MSAFEVGTDHIDAMLTAAFYVAERDRSSFFYWYHGEQRYDLTLETAGQVGAMLAAENRRSVNYRYSEDELEEPYLFHRLPGTPTPVIVFKILSCYEYQSCEHPEWRDSAAHAFCQALSARWIGHLPGYDTAPGWEVRSRDIFTQPMRSRS